MRMTKKLLLIQAALLVLLAMAVAVLGYSVWRIYKGSRDQPDYGNARFVKYFTETRIRA